MGSLAVMNRMTSGSSVGAALSMVLLLPGDGLCPRAPDYTIEAVRYATIRQFRLSGLVMGAPPEERIDIAMAYWIIRGDGRVVLFDTGFHRREWFERFDVADYLRPDSALIEAGVDPSEVTDVIVSHAHWDHMGGIDLFPEATVHIQREEYDYYTGPAWREGGRHGGIDPEDIVQLVRRNMAGKVSPVDGDDVEILPGIRAFTGARHTYASQYVLVEGAEPHVLASDNCYLYRNLETRTAGATFDPADRPANEAALARMERLAGDPGRVIPGHDPLQFERFPARGRVARIR
ncbi:MAG TPA: N-acyl homoserine lactonase family protein [Longimicrobiales bacterium]|nr:N-acyl homoserine lactonase family protein [Longimicrobiales bacterium]